MIDRLHKAGSLYRFIRPIATLLENVLKIGKYPNIGTVSLCTQDKRLQSYGPSNFEDDQIVRDLNLGHTNVDDFGQAAESFFKPPTLTACNFAAHGPQRARLPLLKKHLPIL